RRHGRADDGKACGRSEGTLRHSRRRDPPSGGSRADRRTLGRDRRQRGAPPRRARRLQGRDRHPQGGRAALEERGVRGRRGVDRARLLMEPWMQRDYDPIQPRGTDWRGVLRKITAPIVFLIGLAAKLGSLAKFAAIFVAFGGYALIWGWRFALGVVVLIFVHELGHYLEAARERLNPQWPVFIPFLGAYVKHTRGNPWQTARVAIAGPILGGVAALVCFALGEAMNSDLLVALGYFGFVLNLINLLPFGILDGGPVWRPTRWLWRGGGREKALVSAFLYGATAVLLGAGAIAAYIPQHRL